MLTQGIGQADFVSDKCRFHLGEIRSKTWMLTGPKAWGMIRKVLQAALSGTMIVLITKQAYMSRKASTQSGGKGKGKGRGGPSRTEPESMEINDSDVSMLKVFKRRRSQS